MDPQTTKKLAHLLRSGATMLDKTCPECNVPLFKKGDKIFCGSCNREVIYVKDDQEKIEVESQLLHRQVLHQLKNVLYGKIDNLTQEIANTPMEDIENQLDLLSKTLYVISQIETLHEKQKSETKE